MPDARRAHAFEVTVAICTRDRRKTLLETLDSVLTQRWGGDWQLLVVDNGSSDGSLPAAAARAADCRVPMHGFVEPTRGLSHARNAALRRASGRAVVFIDDDVTCLPGWLAAHGERFRDAAVTATGGPIRPVLPERTDAWFSIACAEIGGPTSRYEFGTRACRIVRGGPIPMPFGANMGVLRDSALAAGGFRTDLGWGARMIPGEETEFFHRLEHGGASIHYEPQAALLHRIEGGRASQDYWSRWHQGYGRFLALSDPPQGARDRWRRVAQCGYHACRHWVRAEVAAARGDTGREIRNRRKQQRSLGQVLEWIGR